MPFSNLQAPNKIYEEKIHLYCHIIKLLLTDLCQFLAFSAEPLLIVDPTEMPVISFTAKGPALWIDENGVEHQEEYQPEVIGANGW